MLGSDIGHWDVIDITDVLPEAWSLVDDGCITRTTSATSSSPTRSPLGHAEPEVLQGTRVAQAAAAELAHGQQF